MAKYAKLYYQSVAFSNDMKHIHTHAIGNKFDRLHNISNEYYEKASDHACDALRYFIATTTPKIAIYATVGENNGRRI